MDSERSQQRLAEISQERNELSYAWNSVLRKEMADEDFPKSADFLPEEPLNISYLRSLQRIEGTREIWIQRFLSLEETSCVEEDVWDLSIGVVPTENIQAFTIDWKGHIVSFEFNNGCWEVIDAVKKENIDTQVFAHQMKSYIELHRAVRAKEREENE